jgi:hypothetical protein
MSPDLIDLNFFETWVQIHKLPIGYRNDTFVKNLTEKKVGKVTKVELDSMGMGNFVRVRVRLDVRKVLARFVSIVRGGARELYQMQYEKIPKFCGDCGLFGHSHLECGSGEHVEEDLKWGEFLKADWDTWHGRGMNSARGRGRGGARVGRGISDQRGRGYPMVPWRHNAPNMGYKPEDPDLKDTATSPGKEKDMDLDKGNLTNPLTKRGLILTDMDNVAIIRNEQSNINSMEIATDNNGFGSAKDATGLEEKDRNKRSKKDGANSPSLGSAGSLDGSARSQ